MSGKRFFSAVSETQAVSEAAAELGVPAAELAYQVRQGALRPGRVVIQVDPLAPRRAAPVPGATPAAQAVPAPPSRAAAEHPLRALPSREEHEVGGDEPPEGPFPATGAEGARRAAAALVALSGLAVEVGVSQTAEDLQVELSGSGRTALVARNGELLRTAEYLLRRMVRELPEEGLRLDSGGFRVQREEALRQRAAAVAEEVRRSGQAVSLEGLDPAERRIVHMAILGEEGVRSASEGEGERRRLTILPADQPASR
jgi:spoIIIJ-associated protein